MVGAVVSLGLMMTSTKLICETEASLSEDDKDFESHLDETFKAMLVKICNPDLVEHYKKKYPDGRPFLYPGESDQGEEFKMQSWTEIDDGIFVTS